VCGRGVVGRGVCTWCSAHRRILLCCGRRVQTLVPWSSVVSDNPALQEPILHLGECVCAHGWEGTVFGAPAGLRTFLVPHRFWYRGEGEGGVQRGTLVAVSKDHCRAVVDVALDGSPPVEVGVECVRKATEAQRCFKPVGTKPELGVGPWVDHLRSHGYPSDRLVYPPRCVAVDGDGQRGWIEGWDNILLRAP
jgi:hypothetical protein